MDEEAVVALKLELKDWEREFADANDGRKPGRDDIKRNPEMAAKYKLYSRFSTKRPDPPSKLTKPIPITPKHTNRVEQATPQRQSLSRNLFKTPSRTPSKLLAPATPSEYDSPITRRLRFGKDERTIDPTPQKSGRVIGLFDLLSPPKKFESPPQPIFATPSKRAGTSSVNPNSAPTSATPKKRKLGDVADFTFSPIKRHGPPIPETPECLRRKPALDFNLLSSPVVPQPFKPPTRGLSKIIGELRALEENQHADEEEAFRDIEEGNAAPKPAKKTKKGPEPKPLRPSSALLDFDNSRAQEMEIPEEIEEALAAETNGGEPQRTWKKKGLKRQTRRVKMRPVTAKAKAPTTGENKENAEVEDGEDGVVLAVHDHSKADAEGEAEGEEVDEDGASNYDEDGDTDYGDDIFDDTEPSSKRQKKDGDKDVQAAKGGLFAALTATKEVVKKTGRKISAAAHTNYKRLKIQSHMPKRSGRFAKRR